jgi:hypothetical protein
MWGVPLAEAEAEAEAASLVGDAMGVGVAGGTPSEGTVIGSVVAVFSRKMLSTNGRICRQSGTTMLWPSADVPLLE